jgi:hypothetical protein
MLEATELFKNLGEIVMKSRLVRVCGELLICVENQQFAIHRLSEVDRKLAASLVPPFQMNRRCSSNAGSHTHRSLPRLKPVLDTAMRPFLVRYGPEL